MFVNFNILNQLGSPAINSNTFANRPAAGQTGRLFVSIDTYELYRDNGTTWDLIGGPGSSTVTGSGAVGQVTYWSGTSSITGNNNLFWDIANERLGIGTTTPGHKLQINGTGTLISLNGGSDVYMQFAGNGSDQYQIGYTDNAADYRRFSIYDSTGAKEVLTIDKQSRYVGINYQYSSLADQPAYTFDVSGSIRSTDSAYLATNGTSQVGVNVTSLDATAQMQLNKTDGYGLYLNYTTSVGSGATTTALYAKNTTASSGYAAVIEERTANTTGGQYPLLVKHSLSSGTAAAGNGTGLQFQLQDDAGTFKTTQLTVETTDAAAATYNSRYRFNVQVNGSSTAIAYINSVGLGVKTIPSTYNFDVNGSANATTLYENGVRVATTSNISGTANYISKFTSANVIGNSLIYDDGNVMTFSPSSVETMRITSTGVGIAIGNNPTQALNLYRGGSTATYMAVGNSNTGLNGTYFGIDTTGNAVINQTQALATIFSTNNSEQMRLTSTGLGIGTSSPGAKLQVTGSGGTFNSTIFASSTTADMGVSIFSENTAGTPSVRFLNGLYSHRIWLSGDASGALNFSANWQSTTPEMILKSGRLGIGTATPTTTLDVNGDIIATASVYQPLTLRRTTSTTNAAVELLFQLQNSSSSYVDYAAIRTGITTNTAGNQNGNLQFHTVNAGTLTEKMTITSGGDLYVGGTTDAYSEANRRVLSLNGVDNTLISFRASGTALGYIYANSSALDFSAVNRAMTFSTGSSPTERMRITSSGELLINTTSDAGDYKLQVNGNSYVNGIIRATQDITVTKAGSDTGFSGPYIGVGNANNTKTWAWQLGASDQFDLWYYNGDTNPKQMSISTDGNATITGSIKTAAPSGGTARTWKLGSVVATSVTMDTANYVEVEINGVAYKLALATPS